MGSTEEVAKAFVNEVLAQPDMHAELTRLSSLLGGTGLENNILDREVLEQSPLGAKALANYADARKSAHAVFLRVLERVLVKAFLEVAVDEDDDSRRAAICIVGEQIVGLGG